MKRVGYKETGDSMMKSGNCCTRENRVRLSGMVVVLLGLLTAGSAIAQISSGGMPASFSFAVSSMLPTETMPAVDEALLIAEDEAEQIAAGMLIPPMRIAYGHDVNLNLNNSGLWETLPNGDRVWRLRVESAGANAMYFWFSEWNIVKGGRLFIYNDNRDEVRGAFDHTNNWHDGTNITAPVPGDALTLEYIVEADQPENGTLAIGRVLHVYRNVFNHNRALDNFGDAQACNININCPEGNNWQDEKRAVAMIVSGGGRLCTGTMIRSLCNPLDPLFMTADHCIDGNQANWVYIFNYEAAGCPNPGSEPSTAQSVSNSTHLMSWPLGTGTDMALLRLSSSPPLSYNYYIGGWDRNNVAQTSTVGIHHTDGDIKKIYGDFNPAVSDQWTATPNTHWKMEWDYGAMCYGASGSGAWDQNSRLKGPLTGGYPCCNNGAAPDEAWYGKISLSWAGAGTPSTRLSDWLDPCGNGATVIDGTYPPIASNDNCNNPLYVGTGPSAFPFSHAGNTTGAANDYAATACASGFPGPDVVYYWYSGCCSTQVTLSTCGAATWDTGIYVRRDSCSGPQVACNDDACGSVQSSVSFNSIPGKWYYFFVDGYSVGAFGAYTLSITGTSLEAAVTNNQCAGSIAIGGLPYSHTSNTCTATNDRVNCIGQDTKDVFYSLTLGTCQTVTVSTCGSCFDTAIEVLTGGACPGTTQVACNDDNLCGGNFTLQSTVTFNAVAGQTYYIVLHGYWGNEGRYALNVTGTPFTPPNDECAGSTVIPSLPYTDSGNTVCANASRPNCVNQLAKDVYYTYTATTCSTLTATTCGSAYDTRLDIRAGGACPGDIQIGCNDDFCGLQSSITWGGAPGVTYYIIVNGYVAGSEGAFVLNVSATGATPPNDLCAGAKFIGSLPFDDIGSTACATANYTSTCAASSASNDVVYFLNIGNYPCQNVRVTGCGSLYDASLHVYSGSCDGTEIACNDDSYCNGLFLLQPTVVFTALPFTNYWIVVDGYASLNSGTFYLHAETTCEPESLVVQRLANSVRLSWKPLNEAAGVINYKVYRALSTDIGYVQIASTPDTTYTDPNRVFDAAVQSFYYVTSDATPFLTNPGDGAISGLPEQKFVSPEEQAQMDAIFIPAYLDAADIEGPNPNKSRIGN